ncbi:porin [Microvirga terricola]|uniref:Porin n=1 Tax=Microvirga terricola TaxID=2719797 RepID=A0ABX0VC27_9HYPH|nr:porin [Microvirga terricola]NIX77058.1 porin [Microvirga terricola]
MKLVKSLLLGSVAGLAAVAGAQAADLPAKKAAPVEYVRVCSTYGAGFFYIPGTETCLRVGGRVRADYLYGQPLTRANDAFGFRARGRIQLDARTATAYGLLRTFVRFEITRSSGTPFGNPGNNGNIATSPNVAEAFVQFGGLTAGRVTSFFSNSDLPNQQMGTLRFDDAPDVDLLAYTFTFGNGFSASISVEDGLERRSVGFVPGGVAAVALTPAGQRAPDLVGNLKYAGTWGTAQLSGAVHQIRSNNLITNAAGITDFPDTEYGFAAAGTVSVNLPQLAPGDALWFAATYANGALAYLSGGNSSLSSSPFNVLGVSNLVLFADGFVNPISGDIKKSTGWSLAGGLRHFWTPQIRQNVFGSYMHVNFGKGASGITADGFRTGLDSFNEWRVGTNVFWQPVAGLDLGVEVMYARLDPRGRIAVPGGSTGSESAWEGRLRVQRDF